MWSPVPRSQDKNLWNDQAPYQNVMVHVHFGKEFPDMRQNEMRRNFLRVGDAGRIAGRLKGEPFLIAVSQAGGLFL